MPEKRISGGPGDGVAITVKLGLFIWFQALGQEADPPDKQEASWLADICEYKRVNAKLWTRQRWLKNKKIDEK